MYPQALSNIWKSFKGDAYSMGYDKVKTEYDIAEELDASDLILKSVGKDDSKVTYRDEESFTTRIKTPDSSKAKRDLKFELAVPPEEGIRKTIDWFRELYGRLKQYGIYLACMIFLRRDADYGT